MHPAARAVAILYPPPVAIFRRDLKRHVAALEHPVDPMRERGAAPHVALVRLERNEAGKGEIRDRTTVLFGQCRTRAKGQYHG